MIIDFLDVMDLQHEKVLETLKSGKLTDEAIQTLELVVKEVAAKYKID